MKRRALRTLCKLMCVVLLLTVTMEAPLFAVESIPVKVNGQTFNVTPGQWVTVRTPMPNGGVQTTAYNVRFMNGRPVALEMQQYMKLVFDGQIPPTPPPANTGGSNQTANSNTNTNGGSSQANGNNPYGNSDGQVAPNQSQSGGSGSLHGDPTKGGNTPPAGDPDGGYVPPAGDPDGPGVPPNGQTGQTGQSSQTGQQTGQAPISGDPDGGYVAPNGDPDGGVPPADSSGSKRTWDPARHPRDPQTGRFISQSEADARGLQFDSESGKWQQAQGQSSQSGQQGQTPGQGDPDGPGMPTDPDGPGVPSDPDGPGMPSDPDGPGMPTDPDGPGQVGQVGQSGQSGQSGQAGEGKPGFKDKISAKFKSGYEAGKGMTNQGFQNVKDSLKSGFSAKNILVTAGITVGTDLALQILRGEKPSARKALRTVLCAEFAGGVVGSVTGAAAGSFFVPFLSAVPVVGGLLSALAPTFGSIVGGSVGAYLAGDLKNGRFSIKEAFKRIDWIGVAGQTIGSTLGASLGSLVFPPFGTIVGGIVGGMVGNWAAHKIAGMFGKGNQVAGGGMAMPTGSNPYGDANWNGGAVTIGQNEGSNTGVQPGQNEITIPGASLEPVGTYASEVQLAYAKYQELYKLYNELLAQGRQEDAMKVVPMMNQAKAQYDQLRAQQK